MIEKTCRCGITKKSFRMDIGPFFISECCEAAGYDHKGRKAGEVEEAPKAEDTSKLTQFFEKAVDAVKKPGRGKLRDMRLEDLKAMALEKGIAVTDETTKKQLIELILG